MQVFQYRLIDIMYSEFHTIRLRIMSEREAEKLNSRMRCKSRFWIKLFA